MISDNTRRRFDKSQEVIIIYCCLCIVSGRARVFRIRILYRGPRVSPETDMECTRIVIVLTKMVNVFNNIT